MTAPAPTVRTLSLANGRLTLQLRRSDWALDRLCDFAARRNPRRGYLVVSKVLGRHIPVRPSEVRASLRDLASNIPADLPGPILVVGLAETAVGLGYGIFEELHGRGAAAAFLHTTRQVVEEPLLCRFEEPHSHASAHLVYRPDGIGLPAIRSLVIVDDEVSTGTTLANLALALAPALPACERIVVATLTDWSSSTSWLERMPVPACCVSLLEGSLDWSADPRAALEAESAAFDVAAGALGALREAGPFGRVGAARPGGFDLPDICALSLPRGRPLRVVGTGEFTYPAFLFAERLEEAGFDVVVQATTRSPIHIGGAIGRALVFADNYGSGMDNFLYNADPADGRLSLICHETPPGTVDPALISALDG
ncbi:MAG TPA: phosphoribosyltransferase domain-containing protein, partial [Allosphingosinicella sp.]